MNRLERPLVVLLLLACTTAVLLHAAWRGPYYRIDDETHVKLALAQPWTAWVVPTRGSTCFPLTMLSYRLDHLLFGASAAEPPAASAGRTGPSSAPPLSSAPAMRVMNGLYHLLAGFLLWAFLRRIGAGTGLAAFVALAWAGHPMACESVCWVAERKNALCALFGFGALLAWTAERRRAWRWPLVALLYVLAGLSKPTALGLLPLFTVLEVLDPPRREFRARDVRHWLALAERLGVLVLISAGVLAAGLYAHSAEIVEPPGGSVWTALLTDAVIFARYVWNTLAPFSLSFFYSVEPVASLADPRLWYCGLALAAISAALLWAAGPDRRPLAMLGVLWFFGALGPNSNIVAIPYWMQDRYAYLPTAGLLLAVGAAVSGLAQRLNLRKALVPLATAALVALAFAAGARARVFASSDMLVVDAAAHEPGSAMARLCAANVLRDRCFAHVRQAGQLPPGSAEQQREAAIADRFANAALQHYEAAGRCTGIETLVNRFTLRVWAAEVLAALRRYDDARTLIGPLPPPDVPMVPDTTDDGRQIVRDRRAQFRGYPPRTLAGAWLIRGEASLRQCATAGITAERKLALAERARHEAEESLRCHAMDHEAYVLCARALLLLADLHAARDDMAAAMTLYNQAVARLKEVPATSLSAAGARRYLENVPPPRPPAGNAR